MLLRLILMIGAGSVFVQVSYSHDPLKTEELRERDGLPNFFKKLKAGGKIKVDYIGGSITNGGLWRYTLKEWLKASISGCRCQPGECGNGGTGPDFGGCRIGDL